MEVVEPSQKRGGEDEMAVWRSGGGLGSRSSSLELAVQAIKISAGERGHEVYRNLGSHRRQLVRRVEVWSVRRIFTTAKEETRRVVSFDLPRQALS